MKNKDYINMKKILGNKIKELRISKGLTIEKLAYENDLAKGNLSEIEKGLIDPQLSTLFRIADGLDVSISELLDY